MKKSKIIILLITLTLPVILYLFLRSFGKNEFALPIFFEEEERLYCNDLTKSEESIQVFEVNLQDSLELKELYTADFKVVHLPNTLDSEIQTLKNELTRVINTFDDLSINILSLISKNLKQDSLMDFRSFLPAKNSKTYLYSQNDKAYFVDCIYAFPTDEWNGKHPSEETIAIDHTLILLDSENRIRGYYDGYETKEVDRLILEIRVLLSNI